MLQNTSSIRRADECVLTSDERQPFSRCPPGSFCSDIAFELYSRGIRDGWESGGNQNADSERTWNAGSYEVRIREKPE